MRNISQPAQTQYLDIPSFPDQLEAIIANIECRLLDSLTPEQFRMVQDLMEATRMLTESEQTIESVPTEARRSA